MGGRSCISPSTIPHAQPIQTAAATSRCCQGSLWLLYSAPSWSLPSVSLSLSLCRLLITVWLVSGCAPVLCAVCVAGGVEGRPFCSRAGRPLPVRGGWGWPPPLIGAFLC